MAFLIIPPVAFLLACLWVAWTTRTPRGPEIEQTMAAHERFRQAMTGSPRRRRVRSH